MSRNIKNLEKYFQNHFLLKGSIICLLFCFLSLKINAQAPTYTLQNLMDSSMDYLAEDDFKRSDSVNTYIKCLYNLIEKNQISASEKVSISRIKADTTFWNFSSLVIDTKKNIRQLKPEFVDSVMMVLETQYPQYLATDLDFNILSATKKVIHDKNFGGAIAQSIIAEKLLKKEHPLYLFQSRLLYIVKAQAYYNNGQIQEAYEAGSKSLEAVKQLPSKEFEIKAHYFVANYLVQLGKKEEALANYRKSMTISNTEKYLPLYRATLMNIGIVHGQLATETGKKIHYDSLRYYFNACEAVLDSDKPLVVSNFNANMAEMYRMFEQHDLAKTYVKRSFEVLETEDIKDWVSWKNAYSTNFRIDNDLGNTDSIILNAEKFSDKILSLYHEKVNTDLEELRFSLEQECQLREEKQSQEIETQSAQNKMYLSLAIGSFLASGLFAALIYQSYLKRKKERDLFAIKQQLLRTQMNPHFTFNTLANIKALINQQENKVASKYISKFSNLLRISLDNSIENAVSLDKEIEAIQLYLDLQKIRFKDTFDYQLVVQIDNADNFIIPTMLIQPFVENCFKHAFKGIDYKGNIDITIYKEGEDLVCKIVDNGVGLNKENETKSKSLSYAITNRRLKLLDDQFDTKGKLQLTENANQKGALVEIIVPYRLD